MIDFFSSWAEQIIIAIVVGSLIEMILPNNKNKKYIKMIIGIYILFTIISPITGKKDLLSADASYIENYVDSIANDKSLNEEKVNQESMDERLQELYIKELEKNIKTRTEQEGYNVISCDVDATLYGEKNQEIKKINLTVSKKTGTEKIIEESNIKEINKVEINIGLEKILKSNNDDQMQVDNNEVQSLKNILSSYYEIDVKKINIAIK
ncbi:MAG: stage III sporulation protein AF [Clostridia bacterium]|nr:stage III sporulation protein AF [Clostridia bacterium]